MVAFATVTTALPRKDSPEGLPADLFTCNPGYKVTRCHDPLKGIFDMLGGGSGGANVAGCSSCMFDVKRCLLMLSRLMTFLNPRT